jgi:caffeoyl-CoA O-methyltransferase
MTGKSIQLTDQIHQYLLDHSLRETDLMKKIREETSQLEMAMMQIAPEQGQFMHLLVKLMGVKKAVEVGVFTGYSALCVASAMPQDGRLIACDVSEEWTLLARAYWAEADVADKIDLRLAPAVETLQNLAQEQAGQFDFAFVDADKANYDNYYELCLELLRPGGLLLVDNVLWSGSVADPDVSDVDTDAIRALNEKIRRDERVDMSMLPVADGLTLVLKK